MVLAPGKDTLVDSTGVLLVHVNAVDPSGVKSLDFFVSPGLVAFSTLQPDTTDAFISYPIPLGSFKHSTFTFYARSSDILSHETVTDTVTVTVR